MPTRFFRREISWDAYRAAIDLVPPPGIDPPPGEYNIAPAQFAPIFRHAPDGEYAARGDIQVAPAYWGLVPVWWKKPMNEMEFSTFNARAETVATSAAFSGAFRRGRCLVPASGFYAWSNGTPFAIALKQREWFCFAGLWTRAMIDGSELDTFTIITTEPNSLVAAFSPSMPLILDPATYERWLDPDDRNPLTLLTPFPAGAMHAWPADPAVGNYRNQGEQLLGEKPEGQ